MIPRPVKFKQHKEYFEITPESRIYFAGDDRRNAEVAAYLARMLAPPTGFVFEPAPLPAGPPPENCLLLTTADADKKLGEEGYELRAGADRIIIRAPAAAGLFYGVQTLRQLLPPEIERDTPVRGLSWRLPAVEIKDQPRFAWRGAHLDVCRHFFPKEFVKKYLDILAFHKMNVFHWHLTEDQGWRIEIKKYPRLTEIGAWRVDREDQIWTQRTPPAPGEKATYGGFYTQEDIREIVEYARQRFITVVPEIEMPAHSVAALAAYPELSCTGGPFYVYPGSYWPITDIFCAGNDQTFEFLENVLTEVIDLFPSPYIHIGGDEAFKENWQKCAKCQQRIQDEHLKDEDELQSYFIKRIEKFINSKGRKVIGWDEILQGGLAPNAAVMSWRGMQGGVQAARSGHDVVMSPTSTCYFDYYQGKFGEPPAIGGYLPLEKVYAFEPVPDELDKANRHHILGAQANVWTEYIPTPEHAEYMLLPRLSALAEVVWSEKKSRDFADFMRRLPAQFDRLAQMKINYRVETPLGAGGRRIIFGGTPVTLAAPYPDSRVLYTLDAGEEPGPTSRQFTGPIFLSRDATITSRTITRNGRLSYPVTTEFVRVDRERNGLAVAYYEGIWDSLPDFSRLKPARRGIAWDISIDAVSPATEHFAAVWRGALAIPAAGEYTFSLVSDDGSQLWINDTLIVDNDGLHRRREASGALTLPAGGCTIEVRYFNSGGAAFIELGWQRPGMEKQILPPNRYLRESPTPD